MAHITRTHKQQVGPDAFEYVITLEGEDGTKTDHTFAAGNLGDEEGAFVAQCEKTALAERAPEELRVQVLTPEQVMEIQQEQAKFRKGKRARPALAGAMGAGAVVGVFEIIKHFVK